MPQPSTIAALTADIVAAYVGHNRVEATDLATIIAAVRDALTGLGRPAPPSPAADRPTPAVPIRQSVTPDHIVCLEDGKRLKMLKRHLRVTYQMTPEEYRARWGLPPEYPMVAPNHAAVRSAIAKSIRLGRTGRGRQSRSSDTRG